MGCFALGRVYPIYIVSWGYNKNYSKHESIFADLSWQLEVASPHMRSSRYCGFQFPLIPANWLKDIKLKKADVNHLSYTKPPDQMTSYASAQ